ncbi:hypothetical protein [Microcoleus sp. herbarium19]
METSIVVGIAAILAILLTISEMLALSSCQANSLSQLLRRNQQAIESVP